MADMHALGAPLALELVLLGAAVLASSGLLALLVRRRPEAADRLFAFLMVVGAVIGIFGVALAARARATPALTSPWALPWGRFSIAIDGLSAAFLLPVLILPALAACYGAGYWSQREQPRTAPKARVFLGTLGAAMTLVVIARDGVLFLIVFELMTLSAFLALTTEDEDEVVRRAGFLYLIASHVSLMCLFAAFALLHAESGSFALGPESGAALSRGARSVFFLLTVVGFGVKAGVMPFHVWLPDAHASSPSHISAVLSGVVIKTGIYGLARVTGMLPDPPLFWGLLLLFLGVASGVIGVAYAIGQHDLKRLLAYHSIENIGIIVMGLGVAVLGRWAGRAELVALGCACAVMHVWNHALFKSLLFLSAGAVVHAMHTREIDRMGGLYRSMGWSALMFLVGAVAICGLPPLNGFISELFLYSGALRSLLGGPAIAAFAAPALAIIGALACACFVKVVGAVFLGSPRSAGAQHARECSWWMRLPMLALAAPCLVLGFAPAIATPLLDRATLAWDTAGAASLPALDTLLPFRAIALALAVATLFSVLLAVMLIARGTRLERTGTWDCGFAAPTGRMQYTASSFADILVRLFGFALQPREDGGTIREPFPRPAAYASHVDDVMLARIWSPFVRWVGDRCAALRQQQSGRIQIYVLYVAIAAVVMLLSVVPAFDVLWSLINR
jgi:hydrogenase-4 component B